MTSARNAVATFLIGGACLTGLAACGGSDTVADPSFLTACKERVDENAAAKAYSTDICKCVQTKLKERGQGDLTPDSKKLDEELTAVTPGCTKEVAGGAS